MSATVSQEGRDGSFQQSWSNFDFDLLVETAFNYTAVIRSHLSNFDLILFYMDSLNKTRSLF